MSGSVDTDTLHALRDFYSLPGWEQAETLRLATHELVPLLQKELTEQSEEALNVAYDAGVAKAASWLTSKLINSGAQKAVALAVSQQIAEEMGKSVILQSGRRGAISVMPNLVTKLAQTGFQVATREGAEAIAEAAVKKGAGVAAKTGVKAGVSTAFKSVGGPAGWGSMAGELVGKYGARAIGADEDLCGFLGAVGGGAGVGFGVGSLAGGVGALPGAAVGAAVGAASWAIGQGVDGIFSVFERSKGDCTERLGQISEAATGLGQERYMMLVYHGPAGVNNWGYSVTGTSQNAYYRHRWEGDHCCVQVDVAQATANLNLDRVKARTKELVRTSIEKYPGWDDDCSKRAGIIASNLHREFGVTAAAICKKEPGGFEHWAYTWKGGEQVFHAWLVTYSGWISNSSHAFAVMVW